MKTSPFSACHRTGSSTSTTDDPHHNTSPKQPRRLPQEWPAGQERYTEEISASSTATGTNPADRTRNIVAIDRLELMEAESSPDPGWTYSERAAKQTCDYHEGNIASPNNNLFFEERSNPLSSKGD